MKNFLLKFLSNSNVYFVKNRKLETESKIKLQWILDEKISVLYFTFFFVVMGTWSDRA